jgi:hypothetical protein
VPTLSEPIWNCMGRSHNLSRLTDPADPCTRRSPKPETLTGCSVTTSNVWRKFLRLTRLD